MLAVSVLLGGLCVANAQPTAPTQGVGAGQANSDVQTPTPSTPESEAGAPASPTGNAAPLSTLLAEATPPDAPTIAAGGDRADASARHPAAEVGGLPLTSWGQAVDLLVAHSESIQIARHRAAQGSAQAELAKASLYPRLEVRAGVDRHLLLGTGTNLTEEGLDVQVDVPDPATLFRGGLLGRQTLLDAATWRRSDTADLAASALQSSTQSTTDAQISALAFAFLDQLEARDVVALNRLALVSAKAGEEMAAERFRLGGGTRFDLQTGQREVAFQLGEVLNAEFTLRETEIALGRLLGEGAARRLSSDVDASLLLADIQRTCSAIPSLEQRADVEAANRWAQVAVRHKDDVAYQLWPNLELVTEGVYTNAPYTPNSRPFQWTVGLALQMQLFDGGQRSASKDAAAAEAAVARTTLKQRRNEAGLTSDRAAALVEWSERQLHAARSAFDAAGGTLTLAEDNFRRGGGTVLDVVYASRAKHQAALNLSSVTWGSKRAALATHLVRANCSKAKR